MKRLAVPLFLVVAVVLVVLVKVATRPPPQAPIPVETGPLGDGLYATVETSLGELVLRLEYERAPITCANFVGLAEGTKPWRDPKTKALVTRPLYDGTTFHRVVRNFMVQGGDPLGTGEGGPGWEFKDEFDEGLRHDGPGVVAMANSGKNTNGSQFFITLSEQRRLDGKHSVFGRVVRGQDVLVKIAEVDLDGETPTTPVVLQKVTIERIGETAKAWLLRGPLPAPEGEADPARAAPAADAAAHDPARVVALCVQWKGLEHAEPGVTRSKEEAQTRAAQLAELCRRKGADALVLARRHGDLPVVLLELSKGQTLDQAFAPAFRLGPGQVSDPCETGRGFMVFVGR